jgi:trans-aconitate methyltransferase
LHKVIAGRDQRKLRLLDIGCGTGRFLDLVKQVWPRLPSPGLDLSEPYIGHAKHRRSFHGDYAQYDAWGWPDSGWGGWGGGYRF